MKKALFPVLFALLAATLIIIKPEICTEGAAEGILLCGRVIIPSLFPLTVCTLFITEALPIPSHGRLNVLTEKLLHLSAEELLIFIFALTGGYPVGASLLNKAVEKGRTSPEKAGLMLCYCVNSGPAFTILAIGVGIYSSKTVGFLLLAAHLLPSIAMCLMAVRLLKPGTAVHSACARASVPDCFVSAVSSASGAVSSVCGWVIFFSVITAYTESFSATFPPLRFLGYLLEVTTAVTHTRSLTVTAFLTGFAGLAIWCQILSLAKHIKINFPLFFLARCFHGLASALLVRLFLKIFGVSLSAVSTAVFVPFYDGFALALSALATATVFLISVTAEKNTGKLLTDVV